MNSLPFSISAYDGLAETHGLIRLDEDEDGLILEFQTKDGLVGILKSNVKEIKIPLSEIESVHLKKGWLNTTLIIRCSRLSILSDIPGSSQGEAKLSVSRKNRKTAEWFVPDIMLKISEYELRKLGAELDL